MPAMSALNVHEPRLVHERHNPPQLAGLSAPRICTGRGTHLHMDEIASDTMVPPPMSDRSVSRLSTRTEPGSRLLYKRPTLSFDTTKTVAMVELDGTSERGRRRRSTTGAGGGTRTLTGFRPTDFRTGYGFRRPCRLQGLRSGLSLRHVRHRCQM